MTVPTPHLEALPPHPPNRSLTPSDYRILLGYNQLSNPSNYSRQMTVNKVILHEDYSKLSRLEKNIVLIQLHHPVIYSTHIFPACVPDGTTKVSPNNLCWISGWGMLSADSEYPGQDRSGAGEGGPLNTLPALLSWCRPKFRLQGHMDPGMEQSV